MYYIIIEKHMRYLHHIIVITPSYSHNSIIKSLTTAQCSITELNLIIVDCCNGITQESGYLSATAYSKPHQSKNTEFGIKFLTRLQMNTTFRREQTIEVINKIRKQFQKRFVKMGIKILSARNLSTMMYVFPQSIPLHHP